MTFLDSQRLLLLWLLPILFFLPIWIRIKMDRKASLFSEAKKQNSTNRIFWIQISLSFLAFCSFVVAFARPSWGTKEEAIVHSGRNVLIVLDVSRSMLAEDIVPNRLERAKADLLDLLNDLQGDRTGLMVFRNGTSMICPFTTDLAFLRQSIENTGIDSAPRGETDIGEALDVALAAFRKLGSDHNAILLLSDGEDLSGTAIETAKKCAEAKIPVFCMGIGNTAGSSIPMEEKGSMLEYNGETVVSKLDNKTLMAIASTSGGVYIPLTSTSAGSNTLGSIYKKHVRALVEQETEERAKSTLVERYQIFLVSGLIFIFIATFLSLGRHQKGKRKKK